MSLVQLEYVFIFDPSELWAQRSLFDESLASMLREKGIEAEIIETPTESDLTVRLLLKPIIQAPELVEKNPKQVLNAMRTKRDFDGKFKKENQ